MKKSVIAAAFVVLTVGLSSAEETHQSFIQTPSACSTLQKVEGVNVFLKTPESCDQGGTGMAYINVSPMVASVEIYNNDAFWKRQKLFRVTQGASDSLQARTKQLSERLAKDGVSFENNMFRDQAGKMAEDSAGVVYSEQYHARIEAEKTRLSREVFAEHLKGTPVDPNAEGNIVPTAKYLALDERVYIFISSSIPNDVVQKYVQMLDKAQDPLAVMVMRGFVGGAQTVKPTMDYLQALLTKDPECDPYEEKDKCDAYKVEIQIDPLLYHRYGIKKVPTVVFAKNVNKVAGHIRGSEGVEDNFEIGSWYALEGDAALDYMLEKINKDAESRGLANLVKGLRKGFY